MDLSNAVWRKASHSSDKADNCIEVAGTPSKIAFRDSKDPGGPRIILSHEQSLVLSEKIKKS